MAMDPWKCGIYKGKDVAGVKRIDKAGLLCVK